MASYLDEAELWKCPKHPSKRRRTGICPICLRERLLMVCPDCANTRPCACSPTHTSSSSSSSSSFSLFPFPRGGSLREFSVTATATGEVGRVSKLIENEPAFRRSRSLAFPFLRSRSKYVGDGCDAAFASEKKPSPPFSWSKISFWPVFRMNKTKKRDAHGDGVDGESYKNNVSAAANDYSTIRRSRSVAIGAGDGFSPASSKLRGWHFPSPMKAFRQSKTSKVHERSPLHRG